MITDYIHNLLKASLLPAVFFPLFYGMGTLPAQAERPNILLLLVDDLKPAIGAYGDDYAHTPHLDALIARGMRFDLAYCNQAVCAPSRFSLMLGSSLHHYRFVRPWQSIA